MEGEVEELRRDPSDGRTGGQRGRRPLREDHPRARKPPSSSAILSVAPSLRSCSTAAWACRVAIDSAPVKGVLRLPLFIAAVSLPGLRTRPTAIGRRR